MKTKISSEYVLDESGVKLAMNAISQLVKINNKMVFTVDLGTARVANMVNYKQLQEELDSILINDYEGAYHVTVYQYNSPKELKHNFEYYFKKKISDIIKKNPIPISENEENGKRISAEELGSIVQREVQTSLNGFKLEYEHEQLKKQYNELDAKFHRLKSAYKKVQKEHNEEIEDLEGDVEKLQEQIKSLQDQANIGKNVLEGVKQAVPYILNNPQVGRVLEGFLPPAQEEQEETDSYTDEEQETINFILDAKEQLGDEFHNIKNIISYLINNPDMIMETITMYQLHEEDKAAKAAS
jgi:hypothetical protein